MTSDNVNNGDFYRTLTIIRDQNKLEDRHDKLDHDIKRLKGELDAAVHRKQQVDYELEYLSIVHHENAQAVNANLISKQDAERTQRILFDFVPDGFQAVKSSGIIHLYNQKLVAPEGFYYIFQTRKDYIFQRIYECGENADAVFRKFARDVIMHYNCPACNDKERKAKELCDWPLHFKSKAFKGKKAWNLVELLICDKCNTQCGEGRSRPCDYYMRKYQTEYNKIMNYPRDLRLLLCERSRQADSPFHVNNMPLNVFKIIVRFVFPASFLTIK